MGNLAYCLIQQGRLEEAERIYRDLVPLLLRVGDTPRAAISLVNLGVVLRNDGRAAAARETYEEALLYITDDGGRATLKANLASLHADAGELDPAIDLISEAVDTFRRLEQTYLLVTCLINVARLKMGRGDLDSAKENIDEAVAVVEVRDLSQLGATVYSVRAMFHAHTGNAELATADLATAVAGYGDGNLEQVSLLALRGDVNLLLGNLDAARCALEEAVTLADTSKAPEGSRMRTVIATLRENLDEAERTSGSAP